MSIDEFISWALLVNEIFYPQNYPTAIYLIAIWNSTGTKQNNDKSALTNRKSMNLDELL